jgi:VanZ family protein
VEVSNIDKVVHFLMYFVLVGVMFVDNLLINDKKPISNKKLLFFFFFAVTFGAIIEIIQHFLPSRSAEWYDLLSNSIGAILGVGVIFLLKNIFFSTKIKKCC